MRINGLNLPNAFVQDIEIRHLNRKRGSWQLFKDESAYGEPLETELSEIFGDVNTIQKMTDELPAGFTFLTQQDVEENTRVCGVAVGEVPYFWDFTKIVCFALSGDDAPFCFDFRENEHEPSIIWWADAYWQRIAPNYETFIQLFDRSA